MTETAQPAAIRDAFRDLMRASEMWRGAGRDLAALERELAEPWSRAPVDLAYKRGARDVIRDLMARAMCAEHPEHDYFEAMAILKEMTEEARR